MPSVRTVQCSFWKDLVSAEACEWHRPVAQDARLVSRKTPTPAEKKPWRGPAESWRQTNSPWEHEVSHGQPCGETPTRRGKKRDSECEYFLNGKGKLGEGAHRLSQDSATWAWAYSLA